MKMGAPWAALAAEPREEGEASQVAMASGWRARAQGQVRRLRCIGSEPAARAPHAGNRPPQPAVEAAHAAARTHPSR